eukprot:gene15269-21351_t
MLPSLIAVVLLLSVPHEGHAKHFLIHKSSALTGRVIEDAKRAKQQMVDAGGGYRHVYWPHERTGQAMTSRLGTDIGKDNLLVMTTQVGVSVLPKAFEMIQDLQDEWSSDFSWEVDFCDAPELVLYQKERDFLPEWVEYIWVMEHTTTWTGDLNQIMGFEEFDDEWDWIGYRVQRSEPEWYHAKKHNWLPEKVIWSSLQPIVRYCRRLLDAILTNLKDGKVQFCGMTGASTCRHSLKDCLMSLAFDSQSPVTGRDTDGRLALNWDAEINTSAWELITANDKKLQLSRVYSRLNW